ncbi:3'(2'),5'-bisphosphate nucleotidase [Roseibium sp. RKSG952]|nr:3'(2'),5'-bisphosphate nucleotidase [Roseibium sp. RKSG952]
MLKDLGFSRFENDVSDAVVCLALAAAAEVLDVYGTDFSSEGKADGSPVTQADARAEKVILSGLRELFPSVPVVAEEDVEAGHLPSTGNRFFLVDPLDGTKEFISRNGEFTVNIALIENGVPVFGVVVAPALGSVYWGGSIPEDLGGTANASAVAYKAHAEGQNIRDAVSIFVREVPSEGLTVLASRSHCSAETQALIDHLDVAERVSVGSSLKLCWVAEGKADLYPRLAPTMQWDIAAGDAILRAAGGHTLYADGLLPFAYKIPENPTKDDLRNPHFIAVGDAKLLPELKTFARDKPA